MTSSFSKAKGFRCYRILVLVVLFIVVLISSTVLFPANNINRYHERFSIIPRKADFSTSSNSQNETAEMPTGKWRPVSNATRKNNPAILLTLSKMKLPKFQESFRNPCWYDVFHGRSTLRCFPYVYLAGFAKCGTSDLYSRLVAHPLVIAGRRKESHYLSLYYFDNLIPKYCWSKYHCASVTYASNFFGEAAQMIWMTKETNLMQPVFLKAAKSNPPSSPQVRFMEAFPQESLAIWKQGQEMFEYPGIAVDGSSTTVSEHRNFYRITENMAFGYPRNTTADWIHHMYPGTKFIMILRNPTTRAYSDHIMRFTRRSMKPNAQEFHQKVQEAISQMEQCFQTRISVLLCRTHKFNGNLHTGLYYCHIMSLLEKFPREQMLFLRFEDYIANIPEALAKVFNFLDLPAISQEGLEFISQSEALNMRQFQGKMFPKTKALLDKFYKPHNENLAKLLEDDRYLWNDQ